MASAPPEPSTDDMLTDAITSLTVTGSVGENKETAEDVSCGLDTIDELNDESLDIKSDSVFTEESHKSQGNARSHKCNCFRKLTKHIVSFETLDDWCDEEGCACVNAVSFMEQVPVETRTAVAKYLSSGNPSHLNLSKNNFHQVFHMAKMLNLQHLQNYCVEFCSVNNDAEIISLFEDCPYREDIVNESMSGYKRTLSLLSESDSGSTPEFYVVFSRHMIDTKKGEKETTNVIVIDISEKMDVYKRQTEQLGKGTVCCGCDIDESPFIFVCGGEDSSQMTWKYDVLLDRWSKCSKMLHGRSKHNVVTDGRSKIFAIGGLEVACIEEYNINSNKWKESTSLVTHAYSAVSVVHENKIYIFGGKTSAGSVSTTQCYNISSKSVEKLPELPCSFFGGEALVFGGRIFIATHQGHMISYDPGTGESYLCTQQPVLRDHFGMFLKKDRIYLVGGVLRKDEDDESSDTPMYRYNTEADRWTKENTLCKSFPVYSACIIRYPKRCSVIPFKDR